MNQTIETPEADKREKDIIFSQSVKAGKRIYYLDVKKTLRGETYLSITESKKVLQDEGDDMKIVFEKHKIFLYREDLGKFTAALKEVIDFIEEEK